MDTISYRFVKFLFRMIIYFELDEFCFEFNSRDLLKAEERFKDSNSQKRKLQQSYLFNIPVSGKYLSFFFLFAVFPSFYRSMVLVE